MAKKGKTLIPFKDKVVSYLKVREGDMEVTVYDKEQKKRVKTGGIKHYRCQEFSMALDEHCGGVHAEYWGATTLKEGDILEIVLGYFKQKTGTKKDAQMRDIKHSSIIFIIKEISSIKDQENKQTEEVQNFEQEQEEVMEIPEI